MELNFQSKNEINRMLDYYRFRAWYWHDQIKNSHHLRERKRCENLSKLFCQMFKDLKKNGGHL